MNVRVIAATAIVCALALTRAAAQTTLTPAVITSTSYDALNEQLTLRGAGLARATALPSVAFDGTPLTVLSATPSAVVASLPNTFTPGTYIVVPPRDVPSRDRAVPFATATSASCRRG
jgi:hypothetical protein